MSVLRRSLLVLLLLAVTCSLAWSPLIGNADAKKARYCDVALWECLNYCRGAFAGDPYGGALCREGCMIGWLLC